MSNGWQDSFPIDSYTMTAKGENRYWSLKPGRFVVLGNLESDGSELVVISVLDETEMVDGVETRVIEEREYEDGELAEISRNFFAMAEETKDVFYFGEDVDYYKDGEVINHAGEWRAGQGRCEARVVYASQSCSRHEILYGIRSGRSDGSRGDL